MRFDLKATITFSDDIRSAERDIERVLKKANDDLLKRGTPADVEDSGARVDEYSIGNEKLSLHILADRYVRAHDALLRLKKRLNTELGPEYHVGVREIHIEKYLVELDLDRPPKNQDKISLPYVDDIKFNGKKCVLNTSALTEKQLKENYVDRIIDRLEEKVEAQYYEGKEEMWELLWRSDEKKMVWAKDPTEGMVERDWLKRGPTKGKWFYRPKAAKILKTVEKIAVEEVLKPLGFEQIIESMMVPFDIWIETGHMEGIPNEAYYICEPKTRDPKEWEDIIDEIKIGQEVPREKLSEMIETPRAGICYAQCPVIYWSLRNETIADDSLPILVYEKSVPSARYESGGRHGIERVDEYHRIEPVYIGTKNQLMDLKEKLIERYKYVFEEVLDIEWRMAKVEPFYLQQAGGKKEEKEVDLGTVDFEAYLPYRGTREDSEWLEIGNLSIFRKYTEAFNIKSQSDELLSGCSGIGIERWASSFLAQKSLNTEDWPERFKEYFGEMPDGFELL